MDKPDRILIVRVGALGDTLMVTPLIRALHKCYPVAELDMLVSSLAEPLVEYNPHLSTIFPLRARNWPLSLSIEKRRLIRRLRNRTYDWTILLESAPRYRQLVEHAHSRRLSSFKEFPFDAGRHAIENNLLVAGISIETAQDLDMELPLADAGLTAAEQMIGDLPQPRIGMHIGWGPLGRKKQQENRLRGWSHTNFVTLIRKVLDNSKGSVVLTGSPQDAEDTQQVCRLLSDRRVRSVAGKTHVRELAAVIKSLNLLVSVDSGPCHMAAALGTPLVVLWGPGRLEQTRPVSSVSPVRIVRHPIPCAPCQSTLMQKSCRRNICMESITPDEVFAEVQELLS
jgi:heptosyltransferase II